MKHKHPFPKHGKKPYSASHEPRREEPHPPRDSSFLWGLHAARAAWLNPKRRVTRLLATEAGLKAFEKTLAEGKRNNLTRPQPKLVERHELDRLLPPGSVHQGIALEATPLPELLLHEIVGGDDAPDLVIALDQVTDPHNVGAIARSAAAFSAGAIIMTERNAPGLTGVLAKAASGAIEHVPLVHIVNLARAIEELQKAGYWCVGLAEEAERDLSQCDLTGGRTALILGAEGEGLRQLTRKKCDELARLPTGGPIGSLNVSNAAAVALYEVRRQKKKLD
jgi:23S rRNA (guanosine2251-2'-O)-methyltransferase